LTLHADIRRPNGLRYGRIFAGIETLVLFGIAQAPWRWKQTPGGREIDEYVSFGHHAEFGRSSSAMPARTKPASFADVKAGIRDTFTKEESCQMSSPSGGFYRVVLPKSH
jgi:hypothetical protein